MEGKGGHGLLHEGEKATGKKGIFNAILQGVQEKPDVILAIGKMC